MSLHGLCRAFSFSVARQQCRSFSASAVAEASYKARKGITNEIRVPTKRAMAVKLRRKATQFKDEEATSTMPLQPAIGVLKALSCDGPRTMNILVHTRIGKGVPSPRGRYKLPRDVQESPFKQIVIFAEGRLAEEAHRAGADVVGGPELVDSIVSGRLRPTTVLCAPSLIKQITPRLGRVLGPIGLMPSDRRGTVTEDFKGYIDKTIGTDEWRTDGYGVLRLPFAKSDWTTDEITKNYEHLLKSIKQATGGKTSSGTPNLHAAPVTKVYLYASNTPGIRIDFR